MRVDVYLCETGRCASRSRAKQLILAGAVCVDGVPVGKPSFEVTEENTVTVRDVPEDRYVSRGGIKLQEALRAFGVDVAGRLCLDVGASTGGFTDCLLQNGAAKVYAVDSGHDQLDGTLRQDGRVVSREGVNARFMDRTLLDGNAADVVVMDVSFISQTLLYPGIAAVAAPGAAVVTLLKPQFEVGKAHIGKNGIVRDEKARKNAVENAIAAAKTCGLVHKGTVESPIKGGSGNTEYLLYFIKGEFAE